MDRVRVGVRDDRGLRRELASHTALRSPRPAMPERALAVTLGLLLGSVALPPPALANPEGGRVVGGSARIVERPGKLLEIEQRSPRAVIDWRGFSIGQGETTRFVQPSTSAIAVNRVTGPDPSRIAGQLQANGQVVIANRAGVQFHKGAQVDVNGLLATTGRIDAAQVMQGGPVRVSDVAGKPGASVVNEGSISVAEGGLVALLGPEVANAGEIRARLGTVALGSAEAATIDFAGDGLLRFQLGAPLTGEAASRARVDHSGVIEADGGQVLLSVRSAEAVVRQAVNASGTIRATSVREEGGVVVLDAGPSGRSTLSGTIDVTSAQARGGEVALLGAEAVVAKGARIDASGQTGGGRVRIGGERQGAGATPQSKRVAVKPGATVKADALGQGPGGEVIVWSTGTTLFEGAISARGGPAGGDGGFAEVSGAELGFAGLVDIASRLGRPGTLLLDPSSLIVVPGLGQVGVGESGGVFTCSCRPGRLGADRIMAILQGNDVTPGGNVVLQTRPLGVFEPEDTTDTGRITVNAPITWTTATSLTVLADGRIDLNAPITATQGSLFLTARGSVADTLGRGGVRVASPVSLGSGSLGIVAAGGIALDQAVFATGRIELDGSAILLGAQLGGTAAGQGRATEALLRATGQDGIESGAAGAIRSARVTLVADALALGAAVGSGAALVSVVPFGDGVAIALGDGAPVQGIDLTTAELGQLVAGLAPEGRLELGSTSGRTPTGPALSGTVTLRDRIDLGSGRTLALASGTGSVVAGPAGAIEALALEVEAPSGSVELGSANRVQRFTAQAGGSVGLGNQGDLALGPVEAASVEASTTGSLSVEGPLLSPGRIRLAADGVALSGQIGGTGPNQGSASEAILVAEGEAGIRQDPDAPVRARRVMLRADALDLAATVGQGARETQATPTTLGTPIRLGNGAAGPGIDLDTPELGHLLAGLAADGRLVLGSALGSARSGGILIRSPLALGQGRSLVLRSGLGDVTTQGAGGVEVGTLQLEAPIGEVRLGSANRIGTVSFDAAGLVSFDNQGALRVLASSAGSVDLGSSAGLVLAGPLDTIGAVRLEAASIGLRARLGSLQDRATTVELIATGPGGIVQGAAAPIRAERVTLRADRLALGSAVGAEASELVLLPVTDGVSVGLGSGSAVPGIDLTTAEIGQLLAGLAADGTIRLGAATAPSLGDVRLRDRLDLGQGRGLEVTTTSGSLSADATGSVLVGSLRVEAASGSVRLGQANSVRVLQAVAAGPVTLGNQGSLRLEGIRAGEVRIATSGALLVAAAIDTTGPIGLEAGRITLQERIGGDPGSAALAETADLSATGTIAAEGVGRIRARALGVRSTEGSVLLDADNAVERVSGSAAGDFLFRSDRSLLVERLRTGRATASTIRGSRILVIGGGDLTLGAGGIAASPFASVALVAGGSSPTLTLQGAIDAPDGRILLQTRNPGGLVDLAPSAAPARGARHLVIDTTGTIDPRGFEPHGVDPELDAALDTVIANTTPILVLDPSNEPFGVRDPSGVSSVALGTLEAPRTVLYVLGNLGSLDGAVQLGGLAIYPGTGSSIDLDGTVGGRGGSEAAARSQRSGPPEKQQTINGCPIGRVTCSILEPRIPPDPFLLPSLPIEVQRRPVDEDAVAILNTGRESILPRRRTASPDGPGPNPQ